ncbi:MAG: zinc-dependent peptidase [Chromatiales bacterium]|nr:zinc-dependent peptidase [Chromatiales bacterium]
MLRWLRRRRQAGELTPSPQDFDRALAAFPALTCFTADERLRLRGLTGRILAEKDFHGAGGWAPEYPQCMTVAMLAAVPLLARDLSWYADFDAFILHREPFEAIVEEADEETGLVHTGRDLRAGEAWERGPVVLAWTDVLDSGQGAGYNVVVHELAHQLDHLNADGPGLPALPRQIDQREWAREFSAAYERLQAEVSSGGEPSIDPYAATDPAEFFAVSCEYFFDAPAALSASLPGVYRLLALLFGQDPLRRQPAP